LLILLLLPHIDKFVLVGFVASSVVFCAPAAEKLGTIAAKLYGHTFRGYNASVTVHIRLMVNLFFTFCDFCYVTAIKILWQCSYLTSRYIKHLFASWTGMAGFIHIIKMLH
jgi:hypothetical protein